MHPPNAEDMLDILQSHWKPREEAWTWLWFHNDGEPGVVSEISGDYGDPEEMGTALAQIINSIPVDNAYLAVSRSEGVPTERDRQLWWALQRDADPGRFKDMVVFNDRRRWSMRHDDTAAA